MRLVTGLALIAGASLAACAPFQTTLDSGAVVHDTVPQKGTISSDWVDCTGGPGCEAQVRALNGGSRPHVTIRMTGDCVLRSAAIQSPRTNNGATPGTIRELEVLPGYSSPTLMRINKADVTTLALGGSILARFDTCPIDGGAFESRERRISFPQLQMRDIAARLTVVDFDT